MVGQEYELEKNISRGGGDHRSEEANQIPQNEGIDSKPTETAEKLAEEHNISRATVERSADLFKAQQAIEEVAPEVARAKGRLLGGWR